MPTELTLKSLEDDLKGALQADLNALLLQVRCRVKAVTLQIFIQLRDQQTSAESQIFSTLSRFLSTIKQSSCCRGELFGVQHVQALLFGEGQRQPYARRAVSLRSGTQSSGVATGEQDCPGCSNKIDRVSEPNVLGPQSDRSLARVKHGLTDYRRLRETERKSTKINRLNDSSVLVNGDRPVHHQKSIEEWGHRGQTQLSLVPISWLLCQQYDAVAGVLFWCKVSEHQKVDKEPRVKGIEPQKDNLQKVESIEQKSSQKRRFRNRWILIKAAVAGLTLTVSGTSVYALTRPCVIGDCDVLNTAQVLNQESQQLLDTVRTPKEVIVAYEKLVEANYQLAQIPFWSKYYEEAQSLLTHYQEEADFVSQIVMAQRQAHEATLSAQEPPHPLPVWEDIRGQWQEAIAQLEQVPPNTGVANLANTKLNEYQYYLSAIDQRITQERDAQAKIAAARQAAQIAEARESVAGSAESWQLVYITWQVVMNRLADISKDTMAYAEAQQLNSIYSARLTASRERYAQEQLSFDAFTQATTFAEQAMQEEQSGRVTQALAAWQNALTNIQQIPEGTSFYEQAQPLLNSYAEELARTEGILAGIVALEEHRPTLNRACTASSPVCSYTLGLTGIQIFMTDLYADGLRQVLTAGIPTTDTDSGQFGLDLELPKVTVLLQTLTTIGNESQVAIQLFDNSDQLIATYDPSVGGYVQPDVEDSEDGSNS